MSDLSKSAIYKEALEKTKVFVKDEQTAVGFNSEGVQGPTAQARQANTILYILTKLYQKVEDIEAQIKDIKTGPKETATPDQQIKDIQEIKQKLNNLSTGKPVLANRSAGTLFVYRDPKKILADERAKLKK